MQPIGVCRQNCFNSKRRATIEEPLVIGGTRTGNHSSLTATGSATWKRVASRLSARFSSRHYHPISAPELAVSSSAASARITSVTKGSVLPPTGFVRAARTSSGVQRSMTSRPLPGENGNPTNELVVRGCSRQFSSVPTPA